MLWPNGSTRRPVISSPFGPRKAPCKGCSSFHRGTDFVGYTKVRAIAAGRVTVVGTPAGWTAGGVQVWIQHDGGYLTRSMHMARGLTEVRVGQRVSEGQSLGTMGATGNVTGVHHHLEVVVNGVQIDPVPFISARINSGGGGGGGTTPPPTPTPEPEGSDMVSAGIYWTEDKNTIVYAILDTGSGWFHKYSNGPGNGPMPSSYNNAIAAAFKTGNFAAVTKGHAGVILSGLTQILPKASPSELSVTLDRGDVDVVKKLNAAQDQDVAARAENLV